VVQRSVTSYWKSSRAEKQRFPKWKVDKIMFRAVFWVVLPCKIILHGSTTQKTALNIILAAVRT